MTQELMDCLDAALKMSDTGESAGSFMVHFINNHILNPRDPHHVFSFDDCLKFCVRWTPTGSSLRPRQDTAG